MSKSRHHTPLRLALTPLELCTWLGSAEVGDTLEYHRGFLAIDLVQGVLTEQKALRNLARRARWAFDHGLVHLVQRRRGPSDFSYLAVKRAWPSKPLLARITCVSVLEEVA
jgi:hypothetical protein